MTDSDAKFMRLKATAPLAKYAIFQPSASLEGYVYAPYIPRIADDFELNEWAFVPNTLDDARAAMGRQIALDVRRALVDALRAGEAHGATV